MNEFNDNEPEITEIPSGALADENELEAQQIAQEFGRWLNVKQQN